MGLYSAFDDGFDDKETNASFSRKCEDGKTRGGKLTGAVPIGMTVESYAEAARMGLKRTIKGSDRGLSLVKNAAEITGEKAARAVLGLADSVPATAAVPPAVRNRGRSVTPSENGAPAANGSA